MMEREERKPWIIDVEAVMNTKLVSGGCVLYYPVLIECLCFFFFFFTNLRNVF